MKRTRKLYINERGFTMIEMVVVLIVMAIIATFILARATPGSNDLIAQAEILKSHLRYAQIRAMNDTVPWGIRIPDANSYILYRNNAIAKDNASNDIILPGEKPEPSPQTHDLQSKGITVTVGVGSTFNFNEWGTPVDAGGSAIVPAQPTITLSNGTTTSNITITKNTGYIP